MNSELLAGKTALVTGSSRGIGREIAIAFVEAATNAYITGQIVSVNGGMYFTSQATRTTRGFGNSTASNGLRSV